MEPSGIPLEHNDIQPAFELGNSATTTEFQPSMAYTMDGSLDRHGKPALKGKTGGWRCATMILGNQGLITLAFSGVEVNMFLFANSVLGQTNEEASNTYNRWSGSTGLFSLLGTLISESYLGRYLTCVTSQFILIIGLALMSLSTQVFPLDPPGCGKEEVPCNHHSPAKVSIFYVSIYLIALGYGGQDIVLDTFGADQFDKEDPKEKRSQASFSTYFRVASKIANLVASTALVYVGNIGHWVLAFWICTSCAVVAYLLVLIGIPRYRHFKPSGNAISRISQVVIASFRKRKLTVPPNGEELYEVSGMEGETFVSKKIPHTNTIRFLDRAAIIDPAMAMTILGSDRIQTPSPWRLCTITQVEEVRCLLRLFPIWLCTLPSSLLFTQKLSLFVEQGDAMDTRISNFDFPPASMTAFDVVATTAFILLYNKLIIPLLTKRELKPPSELRRIGAGLAIGIVALITAGFVEQRRLRHKSDTGGEKSSLSIFWQTPQYILLGAAEAIVVNAQMEFFESQTPDRLKGLGLGLPMASSAIGSYLSSFVLSLVTTLTSKNGKPGWVAPDIDQGHLDRYFFLLAALVAVSLGFYVVRAKRYKGIVLENPQQETTEVALNINSDILVENTM